MIETSPPQSVLSFIVTSLLFFTAAGVFVLLIWSAVDQCKEEHDCDAVWQIIAFVVWGILSLIAIILGLASISWGVKQCVKPSEEEQKLLENVVAV